MILELLKAFIFGIVEGITEWLPVSSTGHMILLERFLSFSQVSDGFWEMFEVVIQFGAILAVVIIFWKDIFPFTAKKGEGYKDSGPLAYVKPSVMNMWFKALTACVPAAVVGVLLDDKLNEWFYHWYIVAGALIVFGIAFIIIENKNHKSRINSIAQLSYKSALIIGLFQLIAAIFPGTSRSGATIVGALLIGISRKTAAEFTFYLAIPVMLGASLLKLVGFGFSFTSVELAVLLTGMVTAFIVSVFVIKFLMDYIKKHDFKVFGWYRIILGILVILYFSFVK